MRGLAVGIGMLLMGCGGSVEQAPPVQQEDAGHDAGKATLIHVAIVCDVEVVTGTSCITDADCADSTEVCQTDEGMCSLYTRVRTKPAGSACTQVDCDLGACNCVNGVCF